MDQISFILSEGAIQARRTSVILSPRGLEAGMQTGLFAAMAL